MKGDKVNIHSYQVAKYEEFEFLWIKTVSSGDALGSYLAHRVKMLWKHSL